jgi:elongation factor Ts
MKVTAKQIKTLRDKTGAGIMEVKRALEEAKGDEKKAVEILKIKGAEKLKKRDSKETNEGQVFAYVHAGGRIASLVKIGCETDFVAEGKEFQQLGRELSMQVASMEPKNAKELLSQTYIRDSKIKIKELVEEVAVKVKEKIVVGEIARLRV